METHGSSRIFAKFGITDAYEQKQRPSSSGEGEQKSVKEAHQEVKEESKERG
jgi:hypothetical protein